MRNELSFEQLINHAIDSHGLYHKSIQLKELKDAVLFKDEWQKALQLLKSKLNNNTKIVYKGVYLHSSYNIFEINGDDMILTPNKVELILGLFDNGTKNQINELTKGLNYTLQFG